MSNKLNVMNALEDLVSCFLYYDRKECESLPRGEIERLVDDGEVSIDEMVEAFRKHLVAGLA